MEPLTFVIFGITSNLSQIYLLQALYDLAEKDLLPDKLNIVGIARSQMSQDELESYFDKVLHMENRHHKHPIKLEVFKFLCSKLSYLPGDLDNPSFYLTLKKHLQKLDAKNIVYYLATYPNLYKDIFENLYKLKLNHEDRSWVRLLIEKPIGNDLKSAQELDELLLKYFKESQIYRLDHYLGKET